MKLPKFCQRRDGRYYLTPPGSPKPVYLGRDRAEAEQAHRRWCAEHLARSAEQPEPVPAGATVQQLVAGFLAWSDGYYQKHGKKTSEVLCLEQACRPLVELYGATPAAAFGPKALKAVREAMLGLGWARGHVNDQVGRVRRVFRWGVEQEVVPPEVLTGLKAVLPLRKGRVDAPEEEEVVPVPLDVLEATLPYLAPRWRAMVEVHLAGAMRAQDVVVMRPCDLDRSGPEWLYTPSTYKTEHLEGSSRRIWLGPKAQAALSPLLVERSAERAERLAWLFPSKGRGRHFGKGPGHLTVSGYRSLIRGALKKANRERAKAGLDPLPHWFPLQVRRTALTRLKEQVGAEAAQAAGGHRQMSTTDLYTRRMDALAREAARRLG